MMLEILTLITIQSHEIIPLYKGNAYNILHILVYEFKLLCLIWTFSRIELEPMDL